MAEEGVIDRGVLNNLLEAVAGDRAFLTELIDTFFQDTPELMAAIRHSSQPVRCSVTAEQSRGGRSRAAVIRVRVCSQVNVLIARSPAPSIRSGRLPGSSVRSPRAVAGVHGGCGP